MIDIDILTENEIEVYTTPDKRVKQRVITYQVPGMAPRTVWVDRVKLPDLAFSDQNPGQPLPESVQAEGDTVRRAAVEADIESIKKAPGPRRLL